MDFIVLFIVSVATFGLIFGILGRRAHSHQKRRTKTRSAFRQPKAARAQSEQKRHEREVLENQTRLTHRRLIDKGVLTGRAYVIDGDTIAIGRIKLRLDSIDAPELDQPYGRKAKWAMVDICRGQEITARLTGEVSYDRLLADCTLPNGTNIGEELIRRGLAIDYDHFSNGRFRHLEIREEHRHIRMARARRR